MSANSQPRRYDLTGLDIEVWPHVFDRALERLGETFTHDRVRQEVFHCVVTGSWSRQKPDWLAPADPERGSRAVYAWLSFRYAYVVAIGPKNAEMCVYTLLTPPVDPLEAPLRKGLLRWVRQQRVDGGGEGP
jgi:hypothetical protein